MNEVQIVRDVPALGTVLEQLRARPEVRRVILFGSRARGDARDRADIDLAVEAPEVTAREWLDLVAMFEETDTLLKIDVVRLEEASANLAAEIFREGLTVYDRPENGAAP